MAVTLNDIYFKALALYDEISKSGTIDPSKTADYRARTPAIADMLQKELMKVVDTSKKYEVACSPIPNAMGLLSGFDIQEFKGTDLTFEANSIATAYYFETDGEGTAYIEDYTTQWNTLVTIPMTQPISGFVAYKGVVTPTPGATKSRIRFSGNYYYRTINRAIFNIPLKLERVPDYTPWVKVQLPEDAKEIVQVITEHPERQYTKDAMYKQEIEGNRVQLYIDYNYVGKLRVQYKPVPRTLTSLDDVLEIDDIAANLMAYGLCKWFAASEQNEYIVRLCDMKFQELKAESRVRQPATAEAIIDVYKGWW